MLLFTSQNLYIQFRFGSFLYNVVIQIYTLATLHTHYPGQDEPSHHQMLLEVSLVFTSLVWSTSLKRKCLFTSFRANTFHISLNSHENLLKEWDEDEIREN